MQDMVVKQSYLFLYNFKKALDSCLRGDIKMKNEEGSYGNMYRS